MPIQRKWRRSLQNMLAALSGMAVAGLALILLLVVYDAIYVGKEQVQYDHQRDFEHRLIRREVPPGTSKYTAGEVLTEHGIYVTGAESHESQKYGSLEPNIMSGIAATYHGFIVECAAGVQLFFDDQNRFVRFVDSEACRGP